MCIQRFWIFHKINISFNFSFQAQENVGSIPAVERRGVGGSTAGIKPKENVKYVKE
jgi:hypothetical protein